MVMTKQNEMSKFLGVEWTEQDEKMLREFVEETFASRTPPPEGDIYSGRWEYRVGRSEMRAWCSEVLQKHPPETDTEWLAEFSKFYLKMARRVVKKNDPTMLHQLKARQ